MHKVTVEVSHRSPAECCSPGPTRRDTSLERQDWRSLSGSLPSLFTCACSDTGTFTKGTSHSQIHLEVPQPVWKCRVGQRIAAYIFQVTVLQVLSCHSESTCSHLGCIHPMVQASPLGCGTAFIELTQ